MLFHGFLKNINASKEGGGVQAIYAVNSLLNYWNLVNGVDGLYSIYFLNLLLNLTLEYNHSTLH